MVVLALVLSAVALLALSLTARRARDAAQDAIAVITATRRDLRPALVLARDDARRAARMHAPHRQ